MTAQQTVTLELDDIQAAVLSPRPAPYAGAHILLRIDDRRTGREGLHRLIPLLSSAADVSDPNRQAAAAVALSFQDLKALGVPEDTLASFLREFQQGMAARATILGDTHPKGAVPSEGKEERERPARASAAAPAWATARSGLAAPREGKPP